MLILTGQQSEGDPYDTLSEECTEIVSADTAGWHESFLAGPPFSKFDVRSDVRWTARFLAFAAVLMAWSSEQTLADRFGAAWESLVGMFPFCRRPGKTYQGFIKMLLQRGEGLLGWVRAHLRVELQKMAGEHWTRQGLLAFAADGSRVECPRTKANEEALGCGGRKGTGPQFWLTSLWHMGTGLLWSWKIGLATDAERMHLRQMLDLLPRCAVLVADAGFTGYELFSELLAGGRSFLIRVGSNVQLLKKLGYAKVENDGTVYLWPERFRKKNLPPLVLRLIVLQRKGKKMYLLTNLPGERLSDEQASILYEMRWGVELFYRSMKQTLARRKMLSRAPAKARAELSWTLVGLQLLGLLSVEQILRSGRDPLSWSVAMSLRAVRLAMIDHKPRKPCTGGLLGCLSRAVQDSYQRRSSKTARNWPHKKKDRPPGPPKFRNATRTEVKTAQQLNAENIAA